MSWKIKIIKENLHCPYRLKGGFCTSSKRMYYDNPVVSSECIKEKCSLKLEGDTE